MDGTAGGLATPALHYEMNTPPGLLPAIPQQAGSDAELVRLWLHGRALRTRIAYEAGTRAFLDHVGKPLRAVTLGDLHGFVDTLAHLAPASQACKLAAIKSLLSFAHRIGYLVFNSGSTLRLPAVRSARAARIMSAADVHRMLALEPDARNAALLGLLYGAGLRISEICGLAWRDLQARNEAGQVTVFGKGGQTRAVLLPASVWRSVIALRGEAGADAPVFRSRSGGGHLNPVSVHRLVKAAAKRAGLPEEVSTHWLRHAHASHSLDRGAPISLVQAILGHASVATTGRYLHARPDDSSAQYLGL